VRFGFPYADPTMDAEILTVSGRQKKRLTIIDIIFSQHKVRGPKASSFLLAPLFVME
jgi:hypothetical protein